jgi:Autographiviridae endonuclease VII
MESQKEEERKRRERERKKQRYAEDPDYREKILVRNDTSRIKHKDARNARRRQRYATDPEFRAKRLAEHPKTHRKFNLKKNYGLSLEGYDAKLARQGGVCVICLKASKKKNLCVDHDHETRKLRDLLCGKCNVGLGNFNDNSAAMRRGADYLDYWQQCHADPDNTNPPPFAAGSEGGFLAPSLPTIQSPPLTGEDVAPTDEANDQGRISRLMRRAILHELHLRLDRDEPPPTYKLEAVARAIVNKASQGDMTAAELLDRIDGKMPTAGPASADTPNEVFFTWKLPV